MHLITDKAAACCEQPIVHAYQGRRRQPPDHLPATTKLFYIAAKAFAYSLKENTYSIIQVNQVAVV